jgi:hypothetical protein
MGGNAEMRLTPGNQALAQAITIHPRAKRSPLETNMLKSVASNKKMGRGDNVVTKGKWAGMPMFQLSLEERASCPSSCKQWDNCYANNMAFAHRIDHTHPEFYNVLDDELVLLTKKYRHGFVVRLHVIGDFFSVEYVEYWRYMTDQHPNLKVFGFTANTPDSDIGKRVVKFNENPNVWIRFSNAGNHPMAANVGLDYDGVTCPVQTKQTESCLTCGLCWATPRNINFIEH